MTQQTLKESMKELKQTKARYKQVISEETKSADPQFPTVAQSASETRGCLPLPLPEDRMLTPKSPLSWV